MMLLPLLLASQAHAVEFRWWGIGPMLGTRVVPLQYPIFPAAVDGTGIDHAAGNLEAGAQAVLYVGNIGRIGLRGQLDTNFGPWFGQEFTLEWDQLLVRDGELQLYLGGGVGLGHERFGDKASDGDYPYLDVRYFPLRLQIGVALRDHWRAYQLQLYGAWHIAGEQDICTAADDCTQPDFTESIAFYGGVGLEATVFFGNFKNVN